jgi:hypothetical protein
MTQDPRRSPVRFPPRPATLDEARRMLVETSSVSFDDEDPDYDTQIARVNNCRTLLASARQEALAGRLFVIDYPTLADDWASLYEEQSGIVQQPFEVTAILLADHDGANPLFVSTRNGDGFNLFTAMPLISDGRGFWGVPAFAAGQQGISANYRTGLITAIHLHNLTPVEPL